MNKTALRNFAVNARRELIERVELQALKIGISKENVADAQLESSDAIVINGNQLTDLERNQRNQLINRIGDKGYEQVIEEVAYTWFNRFVALRYMEVNDYLPTRVRVLSSENPSNTEPDMIREALSIDLEIDKEKVYELKMANNTDELFKYLIQLHCNDLNKYMPFMFETLEDYMMILFPEGLLGTESFVREMTDTEVIPEDNWEQVEVIGWLYQYYISEENQRVIQAKKQYKTEELPAATQLFTPDWIVKYMVQNALGRYWVESHPEQKGLIDNWEYYLQNRQENYAEKIKKYVNNDLNIEEITCFDPAMGSGHILVYMFDVLYEIYEENGYMPIEIPRLIIEKNIYGLDIDKRAYQLASFSVVMKALQYNRRFLRSIEREGLKLNLSVIEETNDISEAEIRFLAGEKEGKTYDQIKYFITQFKDAKVIGSLIKISEYDTEYLEQRLAALKQDSDDMFSLTMKEELLSLFENLYKQAQIMNMKHDVLITNPPYVGNRYIPKDVKDYLDDHYPDVKRDLFSSFIEYSFSATKENGQIGFMTPYVWMFISTYEKLREKIINDRTISSLIQLEYSGFDGATVPICTFTLRNYESEIEGEYVRLADFRGTANQPIKTLEAVRNSDVSYRYTFDQKNFNKVPRSPITYWASKRIIDIFEGKNKVKDFFDLKVGLQTGSNNRFIKYWFEINNRNIFRNGGKEKWVYCNKGGEFRKWYGNLLHVMLWEDNGYEIKKHPSSVMRNEEYYFKKSATWSNVSNGILSVRYVPKGLIFDQTGPSIFNKDNNINKIKIIMAYLNSKVAEIISEMISPTLHFNVGELSNYPFSKMTNKIKVINLASENISIVRLDWDTFETSWDFEKHPMLKYQSNTIESSFNRWQEFTKNQFNQLKANEEELNRIFIEKYGLEDELTPEVEDRDVTVRKADLERDIKSFISYAVGCALGRYSLDDDGLIYAGGEFDSSRYETFPADENNILPILPGAYFEDDIVSLFINFVETTYGSETIEENLLFVAEAIGKRKNETAREAIRRYFLNNFYRDHVQTYKRLPIYWLFTSGREKAFNCLIYMHRYDKTTLSRIRTDYLHDVQARYETEKSDLQYVIDSDASAREIREAKKELTSVEKKIAELKAYDEKLHHMADQQIEIDLDDGVKVNYKKFEGLVARI